MSAETATTHQGRFTWRNGAELVWECDDDCPHPSHDPHDDGRSDNDG